MEAGGSQLEELGGAAVAAREEGATGVAARGVATAAVRVGEARGEED